ncbi:hypothetical protein Peur_004745 [Populus x canadensis]
MQQTQRKIESVSQAAKQTAGLVIHKTKTRSIQESKQPSQHEITSSPAYRCLVEEEIDGNPWYIDIKRFIQYREYPLRALNIDKKTLRRIAIEYYIDKKILYKRSFDETLLRCLNELEANKTL